MMGAVADGADLVEAFANFTTEVWGPQFGSGAFYDTAKLFDDRTMARSWRFQKW